MKVTAKYNWTTINFNSYASFYRWCEENNLFSTKNGAKSFTINTSKIIYIQKDGTKLEVTKTI